MTRVYGHNTDLNFSRFPSSLSKYPQLFGDQFILRFQAKKGKWEAPPMGSLRYINAGDISTGFTSLIIQSRILGKFWIYCGYVAHISPNKQKARSVYISVVISFQ
jgi:hypothetical protein